MLRVCSILALSVLLLSSCSKQYPSYTCKCTKSNGEVVASRTSEGDMSEFEMQQVCDNDQESFNRTVLEVTCKLY